jgi:hypothetical protein
MTPCGPVGGLQHPHTCPELVAPGLRVLLGSAATCKVMARKFIKGFRHALDLAVLGSGVRAPSAPPFLPCHVRSTRSYIAQTLTFKCDGDPGPGVPGTIPGNAAAMNRAELEDREQERVRNTRTRCSFTWSWK